MKPCWTILIVCLMMPACRGRDRALTITDQTLFRVVLKHFATANTWTSTNCALIYVQDRTIQGTGWISDGQLDCELSPRGRVLDADMKQSLRHRSKSPVSLVAFDPGDSSVCVTNALPEFEYSYTNRQCTFKARMSFWMPGYSKDRQSAVVRFGYGPLTHSRHRATGTYKLVNENGNWRVDWAEFGEYP